MAVTISAFSATGAWSRDRYATSAPVELSPDLTAPWVTQLEERPIHSDGSVRYYYSGQRRVYISPSQAQRRVYAAAPTGQRRVVRYAPMMAEQPPRYRPKTYQQVGYTRSATRVAPRRETKAQRRMNPIYLPQSVAYKSKHKPGTIVVDTAKKFLYLIEPNGKAMRYGVGVGKEGHSWKGTNPITRKAEWPDWRPPAEMIERELEEKGRILPVHMEGGPENPLGARALYLGSTLYRIHGTNAPWTIGTAASSGCIRMRNEDVTDLYDRVKIGTKVVVM
ncbi:lipoprotein-anchoring transpeptidase ErfK/SrfK [Phyllobacterium leguminum]|uniref:Lipoprotein-anchoring transpeptidase ErfK/SrfK n=2 Tax=Phyllobacterium leguminum TaxID=314237 RepID=A0A318TB00_9HYPH|nr:lipoprotein-anchoring transpeptidase ErfK/SrfK [Phyllobacterium leguminum]